MEFLMGIVTLVVGKAAEYVVEPIGRQIGYLLYYQSNVNNLKTQIQELKHAEERIEHAVDEAIRNGEEIEGDVQNWRSKAEKIYEEAEALIPRDEGQTKCFSGSSWNLILRYKQSKKARKMAEVVTSEIQHAGKFNKVSYRPPLQISIKNKGYETFETRMPTFLGIMEALRDVSVRMIGVWGMAGVGKTVLVKEVATEAKSKALFNQVVMTTVSQTPDYKKIQQEVAENLGLELKEDTLSVRAERLRQRLRQRLRKEKKILLILDDIWSELDMDAIGISFSNGHKGCKVLLTSRSEDVLRNDMGFDGSRIFKLGVLSEGEATALFEQIVGDVAKEPEYQRLGASIVEECAGLPLAISTLANALKNRKSHIWKDALKALKATNPTSTKGMQEKVYSSIKLSYDFLESKEAKSLFLLCSLQEEDADIDTNDLLRYGAGLRLFDQGIVKLEDARSRVLNLVENLRTSSLLLDGKRAGYVKMHDVVRDVAMSIALTEEQMCNLRNVGELEGIQKDRLENLRAISLSCYDGHLSGIFLCPNLLFLLIRSRNIFAELKSSSQYFEETKKLQVLSLDSIHLVPPLPSFCLVQNLHTLVLRQCLLEDITWIGELRNLEILDLSGSHFEVVPKKIGELYRLRSLDLYGCIDLRVIEPGVISNLVRLEELNVGGRSFTEWEVEEVKGERSNASVAELRSLENLTNLHLTMFPGLHVSNSFVVNFFSDKLERYELRVTPYGGFWFPRYERCSRFLELTGVRNKSFIEQSGLKFLLKRVEELHINRLEIKDVIPELDEDGFLQLKILNFSDDDEVRYIINSKEQARPCNAFQSLEELYLEHLQNLEKMSSCKLGEKSFSKLRTVEISNCNALKNLFHFSFARKLEAIEVLDCEAMETIFTYDREEDAPSVEIQVVEDIEFPCLRSLTLAELPKLTQFCGKTKKTEMTLSQTTEEQQTVDSYLPFFHSKLLGSGSTSFLNLEELIVKNACGSSKYLFSSSVAANLVQLKRLEIKNCSMLEEIISTTDHKKNDGMPLPQLNYLELECLPKLTRFCIDSLLGAGSTSFLNLKELIVNNTFGSSKYLFSSSVVANLVQLNQLKIQNCSMLEEIISTTDRKKNDGMLLPHLNYLELQCLPMLTRFCIDSVPNLKTLHLLSLDGLEMICNNDQEPTAASSFCSLEDLVIEHCVNLKKVFSVNVLRSLQSLRSLTIRYCEKVEEVFQTQRSNVEERCDVIACQLSNLQLYDLPNLKHVWSKDPQGAFTFQELIEVEVYQCASLKNLFPLSVAKDLVQLQVLELTDCGEIEEVVGKVEQEEETKTPKFVFPRLITLRLVELPKLASFYPGLHSSDWPSLTVLQLENCRKMKIFASELLSFQDKVRGAAHVDTQIQPPLFLMDKLLGAGPTSFLNLKELIVNNTFGSSKYLFSSSVVANLVQLNRLKIQNCRMLEEIISTTDHKKNDGMLLPQLNYLELQCLPMLTRFCIDSVPNLKTLHLLSLDGLEMICDNDQEPAAASSFCKLEDLVIEHCVNLKKVFSFNVLRSLQSLRRLTIRYCEKVEEVFEFQRSNVEERCDVIACQLSSLQLYDLPNLKHVWSKDPQGAFTFQKLVKVEVYQCASLKNLFPLSVAKDLVQLQVLELTDCGEIEEVVGKVEQEEETKTPKFVFPRLITLRLVELPKLTSFYPGLHSSDWPSLTVLELENCRKMKIFASELLSFQDKVQGAAHVDTQIQPPLFLMDKLLGAGSTSFLNLKELIVNNTFRSSKYLFSSSVVANLVQLNRLKIQNCSMMEEIISTTDRKKNDGMLLPHLNYLELQCLPMLTRFCIDSVPNLKTLHLLSLDGLEMICDNDQEPTAASSFCSLEDLVIEHCVNLKKVFSVTVLRSLQSLRSLTIRYCEKVEEVFQTQRSNVEERCDVIACQLSNLQLYDLPNLKHVWSKDPQGAFTFQELIEVEVYQCVSLKNLFPLSVAKDLVQLQVLELTDCGEIEEVVGKVEQEEETKTPKFVFPRLITLRLVKLPKLTSFYPGLHSSDWPSLTVLELENCRKMKIFASELLSFQDKVQGAAHVDTQIQPPLFLMDKLLGAGSTSFLNLKELIVNNTFGSSKYLFSSSVVANLVQLNRLKIQNCSMMEEIISTTDRKKNDGMLLPHLNYLELQCLPMLTRFCIDSVPNLKTLHLLSLDGLEMICDNDQEPAAASSFCRLEDFVIEHCVNLKKVFSFNVLRSLQSLRRLAIGNCEKVEEVFEFQRSNVEERCDVIACQLSNLQLYDLPNLKHVWSKDPQGAFTFQELIEVEVYQCASLKNLFPLSVAKDLVQLQVLVLMDCGEIEEVVGKVEQEEETKTPKFVFPRLITLRLVELPKLASFYPGLHSSDWPSLTVLELENCRKMKIFASELLSFQDKVRGAAPVDTQIQPPLFLMDKVFFPKLKTLKLLESLDWDEIQNECIRRGTKQCSEMLPRLEAYENDEEDSG